MRTSYTIVVLVLLIVSATLWNNTVKLEDQMANMTEEIATERSNMDSFMIFYTMSVEEQHEAYLLNKLASTNFETIVDYVYNDEIEYDLIYIDDYVDTSSEQFEECIELCEDAENRLIKIYDAAPSDFYEEDIEERINLLDQLKKLCNRELASVIHFDNMMYEINYGTEEDAEKDRLNLIETYGEAEEHKLLLIELMENSDLRWGR